MTLGNKISERRKQLNLSQEQLGKLVGVGKKTISNWEKGSTEPNASNIVLLARSLDISTDKLLCFNDRRNQLEKIWQETFRKYGDDPHKSIEVSLLALEEYPFDKTFLFRAAVDEERLADIETDSKIKSQRLNRAMNYAQILKGMDCDSETVKQMIVGLYSKLGDESMAIELAYECKNVDMALKFCLKGDSMRRHRQQIICKKLNELIYEIPKNDLNTLDISETIINTVIPDGNYQYFFNLLDGIYISRAQIYIKNGDCDAAISTLKKLFEIAKSTDEKARSSSRLTAPLFDLLEGHYPSVEHFGYMRLFLLTIEHDFQSIRDNKEMLELVDKANAYIQDIG